MKENSKLKIEHEIFKTDMERFSRSFEMLLEHSRERDVKVDEMYSKVDEMYKIFNNGTFLIKVLKWIFALTLALGGAYIMFKDVIHGQN